MPDFGPVPQQDDTPIDGAVLPADKGNGLAQLLGFMWIARGVYSIARESPSALTDPAQLENDHLAFLSCFHLLMLASELYFGGFLMVIGVYGNSESLSCAFILSLFESIARIFLMIRLVLPTLDSAGFTNYINPIKVDIWVFGGVSALLSLFGCLAPGGGNQQEPPLPIAPKVLLCLFGMMYAGHLAYACFFQPNMIINELTTPDFLSSAEDFKPALSAKLTMLGAGYTAMFTACFGLGCVGDSYTLAMCIRSTFTWTCINVMVWLAFKAFQETMGLSTYFVNVELLAATLFAALACLCSVAAERIAKPELYYRHSMLAA